MQDEGHAMLPIQNRSAPPPLSAPSPPSSRHSPRRPASLVSLPTASPRSSIGYRPGAGGFQTLPGDVPQNVPTPAQRKLRLAKLSQLRIPWVIETLSYVVAILALMAIVILLKVYEGKPLPQWPSLISINSLISIFTSIFKAVMLLPVAEGINELKWAWYGTSNPLTDMDQFDSASRGPVGAFELLARFRFARSPLTLLAAAITVAALAIDPFTQQILQYEDCLGQVTGLTVPSISVTNNYTAAGIRDGAAQTTLDFPMYATLYQGLLTPPANATASIHFNFPTGNCTSSPFQFADGYYTSLEMCSSVTDITDQIQSDGNPGTYALPSGLATFPEFPFMSVVVPGPQTVSQANDPLARWQAIMVNCVPGTINEAQQTCSQIQPWAFEATLFPCIRAYSNANISKGVLYETVSGTPMPLPFMNMSGGEYFSLVTEYPYAAYIDPEPSTIPSEYNTIPTSKLPDTDLRYYNASASGLDPDVLYYPPACVYEYGTSAYQAITGILQTLLGVILADTENNTPLQDAMNLTLYDANSPFTVDDGPIWLQRLYANGTVNLTSTQIYMEGLANAITATMRARGDASNSIPVNMTMLGNQTCVRVQWAWITLPAVLLALTAGFFVAMILQSRRSRA